MISFEKQVAAFAKKAKLSNEKAVRGITIKLFSAVIKSSPVDTGRFRNNWFASFGQSHSSETTTYKGTAGSAAINRAVKVVTGSESYEQFTLANNLDYAAKLEYGGYTGNGPNTVGGYSKQAPQGMVRINTIRFQQIVDAEVLSARR